MITGLKTQEQLVSDECNAIQNYAKVPFDFPEGSVLRALVEAHGRNGIWLESIALEVLAKTRLATSTGEDVDSYIADFTLTRAAGTYATGYLTFSSYSTTEQRIIPVGSTAQTTDGLWTFVVVPDLSNQYYHADKLAYIAPIGIASITVSAKAASVGVGSNVLANTITVINSPITGISNVTNALAFSGGTDKQSDASVKKTFPKYLSSLKRANKEALEYAVSSVTGVTDYNLIENKNYLTDVEELGKFYAIIDDGTGYPSDALVLNVLANLEVYRGFTIRYEVYKPVILLATVTANVILPPAYTNAGLESIIETAVIDYINSRPIGEKLFYWRLAVVIGDTINANVPAAYAPLINTTNILLDSGTSDVAVNAKSKVRASSVTITVSH